MTTKEEIIIMKKDVNTINEKIDSMDKKMDMIIKKLLDPDSGLVIKVNKNTERLDIRDEKMPSWLKSVEEFKAMKKWKKSINKALWVLYSAAVGLIIKLLFWD